MKSLILFMLCLVPWLTYAQETRTATIGDLGITFGKSAPYTPEENKKSPQEQLVLLMQSYNFPPHRPEDMESVGKVGLGTVYRSKGHIESGNIQALLDAGASFDVKDKYGRTPIFYLASPEVNLGSLLRAYSIDLAVVDNDGYTLYEYFLKHSVVLFDRYSVANGASFNFMNFMEDRHAPYDVNKILFSEKVSEPSLKWQNKYVGQNISQIKWILEAIYLESH